MQSNDFISTSLVITGIGAIAVAGLVAVYFALFKTDRLQTEEHITRIRQYDLIESKGNKIPMNPVDLPAIGAGYPYQPAIQSRVEVTEDEADDGQ